jgi:hypothetical protein
MDGFSHSRVFIFGICLAGCLAVAPAHAQADFTAGAGMPGGQTVQSNTYTQAAVSVRQAEVPALQAATNATISPQGQDATAISGINTGGTVRVNNLTNEEALLNIMANGLEILGIAWGSNCMLVAWLRMSAGDPQAKVKLLGGAAGTIGGLSAPALISWLVATARDANLFS